MRAHTDLLASTSASRISFFTFSSPFKSLMASLMRMRYNFLTVLLFKEYSPVAGAVANASGLQYDKLALSLYTISNSVTLNLHWIEKFPNKSIIFHTNYIASYRLRIATDDTQSECDRAFRSIEIRRLLIFEKIFARLLDHYHSS